MTTEATTELSPVDLATKELNDATTALDEIDREITRLAKTRGAAAERWTVARKNYDRLIQNARMTSATAAAHGRR